MNTFIEPLARAVRCYGRREAVVDGSRRFTFEELGNRVDRVGTALSSIGARPGDRIAVLAENSHQYVELYLGAPSAGHVVVPLTSRLALPELQAICTDCEPRILFTDRPAGELGSIPSLVGMVRCLGDEFDGLLGGSPP